MIFLFQLKKYFLRLVIVSFIPLTFILANPVFSSDDQLNDRAKVLATFIEADNSVLEDSFDERRDQHKILFYMGVLLLIFVLLTAGFGVSMAMLGKEVFVPHMIFAGLTVFLSIAHAVVAVVWFFPF